MALFLNAKTFFLVVQYIQYEILFVWRLFLASSFEDKDEYYSSNSKTKEIFELFIVSSLMKIKDIFRKYRIIITNIV